MIDSLSVCTVGSFVSSRAGQEAKEKQKPYRRQPITEEDLIISCGHLDETQVRRLCAIISNIKHYLNIVVLCSLFFHVHSILHDSAIEKCSVILLHSIPYFSSYLISYLHTLIPFVYPPHFSVPFFLLYSFGINLSLLLFHQISLHLSSSVFLSQMFPHLFS